MPHPTYTVDVRMFWHVARRPGTEKRGARAFIYVGLVGLYVPENKGQGKKETPSSK